MKAVNDEKIHRQREIFIEDMLKLKTRNWNV